MVAECSSVIEKSRGIVHVVAEYSVIEKSRGIPHVVAEYSVIEKSRGIPHVVTEYSVIGIKSWNTPCFIIKSVGYPMW